MNQNIFNNSGSLTDLFKQLREKSINRFNSIDEIMSFKNTYNSEIEDYKNKMANEIIEETKSLINENNNLQEEYIKLKNEQILLIDKQIENLNIKIQQLHNGLFSKIKKHFLTKKLNNLELNKEIIVEEPLKSYSQKIEKNKNRIKYLTEYQNNEINERSNSFVKKIEFINSELKNLSNLIYGSIGELKAINVLKQLPEQYYIINDFRESFYRQPLFYKSENEKIFSVQIDHIVIGPTGIYVIETKYWNQKSIDSDKLFSPIKQVKRGGFVLFIILNDIIKEGHSNIFYTNWGQTKLSVSNILLMTNFSTNEQFQFVTVLTVENIINHITRRPVILNENQIKYIVNRLK